MNKYYFELVQSYPGSPKLGTIVTAAMNEYYEYKPKEWPQFWKAYKLSDVTIITADGVELKMGDTCHILHNNGGISTMILHTLFEDCSNIYSTYEAAIIAKSKNIFLKLEEESVIGEDVKLYGVLAKAEWHLMETTSSQIFYRAKPLSEKWKFFTTKEKRDNFIKLNKTFFSVRDISEIFSECYGELLVNEYEGFYNTLINKVK